ncbi:MAG: hypothetical protein Q9190_001006 [Brigantiaea leucoxantha]
MAQLSGDQTKFQKKTEDKAVSANQQLKHDLDNPDGLDVETNMFFLDRDELYNTVKPYVIRYDVQTRVPRDNIKRLIRPVKVKDLRGLRSKPSFNECGFQVLPLMTSVAYDDFENEEKIRTIHVPEILGAVKENFAADDVHALEHVIRRRHPSWPVATGESYDHEQPTSRAHLGWFEEEMDDVKGC